MGNGAATANDKQQRVQSQLIDAEIRKDQRVAVKIIKMLLLGSSDCGKSTIVKQMRLLHGEKFSDDEHEKQKSIIRDNVLQSTMAIISAMSKLSISYADKRNEERSKIVTQLAGAYDGTTLLPVQIVELVEELRSDSGVRECFARSNEYQLSDSTQYFLDNLERIMKEEYQPSDQDILRARVPTTGVVEVRFEVKDMNFRVFDVGGQRSERKKWIHCFDNVKAVMFITSLSEYDMKLAEDEKTNRMHESLQLFASTSNSPYFAKANMLLFLNKKDLFEEKIKRVSLRAAFPEYEGSQDYAACVTYIAEKFLGLYRDAATKHVYVHETCATDTTQMEFVIDSTLEMIMQANATASGLT